MNIENEILKIYEEINENKNNLISELNLIPLETTNYSNVKYDTDGTQKDIVNKALLDDIQSAAKSVGIVATITTASTGHSQKTITGNESRHPQHTGVDVAILNGIGSDNATNGNNGNAQFRELGNKLKDALVSMGYVWNVESGNPKAVLWQTNTGGNHFNHLHISNNTGEESTPSSTASSASNVVSSLTSSSTSSPEGYTNRDPIMGKVMGQVFGKVFGVSESTYGSKIYLTFCNVSNPSLKNGKKVSAGEVIGKTTTDVKVHKYDENHYPSNFKKNEFKLGKNVSYSFNEALIPSADNEKIKSPISGTINNIRHVSNCPNQLTIESDSKLPIDNDKKPRIKDTSDSSGRDPLLANLVTAPFRMFQDKYDESGNLVQKRWGRPGEKVDPWIVDAISAPFKQIGKIFKEEDERKNRKIEENIEKIKRLIK